MAKAAPFPSLAVASPMDSTGRSSSSVIVPVADASVMEVPVLGELSSTMKVSSSSSRASWVVATLMVLLVSPAAKFSVCAVVCSV